MDWKDIAWQLASFAGYLTVQYLCITATSAYAVGYFVGVNSITWDPGDTRDKWTDRWFTYWIRFGIRRGAKTRQ
jgi:hypothetical protein